MSASYSSINSKTQSHSRICVHQAECPNCPWMKTYQYNLQRDLKIKTLNEILNFNQPIRFHSFESLNHRDRSDFIYENNKLGFYLKSSSQILPLSQCRQMSADLWSWYQQISQIKWPIQKGSVRLRTNHKNQKGIWLDFSNLDIKNILTEKSTLEKLQELTEHIEIGQRRKSLSRDFKLVSPIYQPWSQTLLCGNQIDLYSCVGSFTQTGIRAQKILAEFIESELEDLNSKLIFEFGSGVGTLTFPALGKDRQVFAAESEELALRGLESSVQALNLDLGDRLKLLNIDLYHLKNSHQIQTLHAADTILVNPPRSGLKSFVQFIVEAKAKNLIYISCSHESLRSDWNHLQQSGFKIKNAQILDQFAHSSHFESLISMSR